MAKLKISGPTTKTQEGRYVNYSIVENKELSFLIAKENIWNFCQEDSLSFKKEKMTSEIVSDVSCLSYLLNQRKDKIIFLTFCLLLKILSSTKNLSWLKSKVYMSSGWESSEHPTEKNLFATLTWKVTSSSASSQFTQGNNSPSKKKENQLK